MPHQDLLRASRLLAFALVLTLAAGEALAEQYDVPILIDSEDGLIDLLDNGDITEAEFDVLTELFQRRVFVNRAGRDELFELPGMTYPLVDAVLRARRARGHFTGPEDLATIDELPAEVLDQIVAFLEFELPPEPVPGEPFRLDLGGQVRLKLLDAVADDEPPAIYTRVRLHALDRRLNVGWVGLLRTRPGELVGPFTDGADSPRPWFVADAPAWRFDAIPKLYASWREEFSSGIRLHAVAGSFNAGFGERLVFDTTNRRRPYGLYEDDLVFDSVGSFGNFNATFRRHRGLFGGAVHLGGLGGDDLWVDATLLASHARSDEFTNFFNPSRTYYSFDEGLLGERNCGAAHDDRCFPPSTFPNARASTVFGGNTRVHFGSLAHVGLTAYAGSHVFTAGDAVIDFTPSASTPIRRSYWALGPEFAWQVGVANLFGELAITDLGGVGAVVRSLFDLKPWALEVSARYYDKTFDNPYNRGEATSSQLLGRRNRDETGGRVRLVGNPIRELRLLATLDITRLMARERTDLEAFLRVDYDISALRRNDLRLSAWAKLTDRDITVGGRDQDYDNPSIPASAGPHYPDDLGLLEDPDLIALDLYLDALFDETTGAFRLARGMRLDVGGQAIFRPLRGLSFTLYGRYSLRDRSGAGGFYDESFQRMLSAWARIAWRITPEFDLSLRGRYYRDELDRDAGAGFFDGFIRAGFTWPGVFRGSLRYDVRTFTVGTRTPDPDHLVRFVLDVFF